MVVFTFYTLDKDDKERAFEDSFLLTNIKLDVVFEKFFLTLSNSDIDVQARTYNEIPIPLKTYFQLPKKSS